MSFAGFFLKFGKAQHILDLQQKGELFFNTVSYFTKIEDGNLRGDKLEDVIEIDFVGDAKLALKPVDAPDSEYKSMDAFNLTWFKRPLEPIGNLFCLYAIDLTNESINQKIKVQKEALNFGNYCLFIREPHEFLRRVTSALTRSKFSFSHDMVKYIDLTKHKGPKTVFQKDLIYSYQQEFRIFIKSNADKPIIIEAGDLSDISSICHARHINDLEIIVAEKNGVNVNVLHNLNVAPQTVFMPISRPKKFMRQLNGIEFHFELDMEEIETVYLVKGDNHFFSMVVSAAHEWIIKGYVPEWLMNLEDELGEAINNAIEGKSPDNGIIDLLGNGRQILDMPGPTKRHG